MAQSLVNNSLKGEKAETRGQLQKRDWAFLSIETEHQKRLLFFFELQKFNWEICQNWDWNPGPWQKHGCSIQEEHCALVLGGQSQVGLGQSWTDIRMAR